VRLGGYASPMYQRGRNEGISNQMLIFKKAIEPGSNRDYSGNR